MEELTESSRPCWDRQISGLLVAVILGLVILLSLVFCSGPHYPSERALRATCVNNLKQIGLSLLLYAGDNNGSFPRDSARTTIGSFALLTNRYQISYKTWICASDWKNAKVMAASPSEPFTATHLSYAYGAFGPTTNAPAKTAIACDSSRIPNWTGVHPWEKNQWTHKSDGGNVLF